jgi:hypothetical protein
VNNFAEFITPEKAKEFGDVRSLKELRHLAKLKGKCSNCDEHVWRYGTGDLCFSCTTGEADASGDYEIGEWHP